MRPKLRPLLAGLCIGGTLMACSPPDGATDLRVRLEPPALGYQVRSASHVVAPGQEVHVCDVVRIEPHANETLIWLNAFESRISPGTHHLNLLAGLFSGGDVAFGRGMAESMLGRPAGQYDCAELGDLMEAQSAQPVYSTQVPHQEGAFPTGVAVPAVVPLLLVMDHHYINTTDQPVRVDARVNLLPIDESEVKHIASVFIGRIEDVLLLPRSRKVEARTCRLTRDFNLAAVSSHAHERADCFTMSFYRGETGSIDPTPFYVSRDWQSPPFVFLEKEEWAHHQVMTLRAGDGIHWACHYTNWSERVVRTGGSTQDEMCLFVGVGYPAPLTVADIKAIVANPTPEDLDRLRSIIAPCEPVTDAVSPWPAANEVRNLGDPPSDCSGPGVP